MSVCSVPESLSRSCRNCPTGQTADVASDSVANTSLLPLVTF
jgi:hypothetical protein